MNLIKSFNFKFFKENVKKSKGAIALLVLIVPIFTLLSNVLLFDDSYVNFTSIEEISMLNCFGMYIIPVLISFVLFGYVYKKNSVDFINSQPINRKTIFITNTLGGVILITLIQVITAIILLICGAVLPNLLIFPKMVLDIFVMMWIGYVFVFFVSNLAMTVSGTFCTQIVITLLILFLVPFCYDGFRGFDFSINYEIINGENGFNGYVHTYEYYTFPYQLIHSLSTNYNEEYNMFSLKSLSRTVILGIMYYFIGLHLFKNRKMENNEESFANEKIHIIIKALTMFPMMIILNLVKDEDEIGVVIFGLAIIITYYFIYDFIVKRKIKLKISLIYLFITLAVLQGACSINELIETNKQLPKLNLKNIAEVKIEKLYYYNNKDGQYVMANLENGGYIENKDFINLIFDSAYRYNMENYITEDSEVIEDINTKSDIDLSNENDYADCDIVLRTKNGKLYSISLPIYREDFEKIKNTLANDEKFVSNIKNSFVKNGVVTLGNYMIIDGEEKDNILREIETQVNIMTFDELTKQYYTNQTGYIGKYFYENHNYQGVVLPIHMSNEIFKITYKYMNKAVVNKVKEESGRIHAYYIYNYEQSMNSNMLDSKAYLYYSDDITKFILANENEEFDPNKPYYSITIEWLDNLKFYTNKVDEINSIIARAEKYEKEYEDAIIY